MITTQRAARSALGAFLCTTVLLAGCTGSDGAAGPAATSGAGTSGAQHVVTPRSTPTPSPKPAPAGPAMTAAEARALLAGLKRQGWRCVESISTPFQVDRCFGTVADTPDPTDFGVAQLSMAHALPRSKGGGPLAVVRLVVLGPPTVEARGRQATLLIGDTLFEGQGALLARTISSITDFSGAVLKHSDPSRLYLSDDTLHVPDYVAVPFATTTAVQRASAVSLPALRCTYSTDFNCRGRAATSTPIVLVLEARRRGTVAPAWYVSADPVHRSATAGRGVASFRPYVDATIDAMAKSGITTPAQTAYLRAHHHDPIIETDLGGHHLVLDYDAFGGVVISDEPVFFG